MTMPDHERRRSPRFRTIRRLVHLSWWEGPYYYQRQAHLEDLSRTGARIVCRFEPPGEGAEIWITLACHAPEPWHRAMVLEASHFYQDQWHARLSFPEPFPEYSFESAVTGSLEQRPEGGALRPPPRPTPSDGAPREARERRSS
jgi:hypothetical protein